MPLQPIQTSSNSRAEQAAQQIIAQITRLSQQVVNVRKNGLSAQPERKLPNGQTIPAQPAVSGEEINNKLGSQNIQILDALASALGTESTVPNDSPTPV